MEPVEAIRNPDRVPDLVKRGVMGVMRTLKGGGSDMEKFENAFNITVWRLTEGLKDGTKTKKNWRIDPKTLRLTKVGRDRQREKQTDRASVAKIREFNRLAADLRRVVQRSEEQ